MYTDKDNKQNISQTPKQEIEMQKVTFPKRSEFYPELKKRVGEFLREKNLPELDGWQMYLQSAVILTWLIASYVSLVFYANSIFTAILSGIAVAAGFALVGFDIQHDGNHGGYSKYNWVNELMGYTLNLIGADKSVWRQKHNILHHTFTNIRGHDSDIALPWVRLSQAQPWQPMHRYQHIYTFGLYCFVSLSWIFLVDFQRFFTGRIGQYRLPKKTTKDYVVFFVTKVFYLGYAVVLPCFFHPVWVVALFFFGIHLLLGFTLAIVFQLAHVVEGTTFPTPNEKYEIENAWAIHEAETTFDFAISDSWLHRLVTWCLGGLNFQVIHHLFPRMNHTMYPKIVGVVRAVFGEFNVSYNFHGTIREAVGAHYRLLKDLSKKPT